MSAIITAGPSPYLTRDEACAHMRVSDTTLWRLVREGKIRPYRPRGRRVLFSREEVDAHMANSRQQAGQVGNTSQAAAV